MRTIDPARFDAVPSPLRLTLRACLLVALGLATPVVGQDTPKVPDAGAAVAPLHEASPSDLSAAIVAQQATAKADLSSAEEDLSAAGDSAPPRLRERVDLLRRLSSTVAQQASIADRLLQLAAAKKAAEEDIQRLRSGGSEDAKTTSFLALDRYRDDLAALEVKRVGLEAVISAATESLDSARSAQAQLEREVRALQDSIDRAPEATRSELLAQKQSLELKLRVAKSNVLLRALELRASKAEQSVQAAEVETLAEKVQLIGQQVTFSQEDLRTVLADLEKQELRLRSRQSRLEAERGILPILGPGVTAEEAELDRAIRENLTREIASVGAQLERLSRAREIWGQRHRIALGSVSRDEMRRWQESAKEATDKVALERGLLQARREETDREVSLVQDRIKASSGATKSTLERILGRLQDRERMQKDNAASLVRLEVLQKKLVADLAPHVSSFSIGERVAQLWDRVVSVWTFQVFSIDDRPITVGKILIGLFLLSIGFTVSRWGSNFLGRRLLPRFGVNEGFSGAVQSVSFYVLMLTFALFALRVANVPLTVFTLLGGAVAIGIGFGSQNIMNNFISGLILLAERPVRVGDMIQVGDLYGNVEHIGPRSTRVTTGDNLEIIVPNSSFLESNVVNWTLSTKQVRSSVVVGVAYGSPTRDVSRLLQKAADEHGKVLRKPAPFVLFDDFGNDALIFEVFFWTEIRSIMNVRTLKSDLRFRIDALFGEAGIVIAYPQRDIHIDTLSPIEVRMIGNEEPTRTLPTLPAG